MTDFRSDTVTRPSPDMKRAMMDAVPSGDRRCDGRHGKRLRSVTHLDVSRADTEQALALAADF